MALTNEQKQTWEDQVEAADAAYMTGAEDSEDVQADLQDRVDLSKVTFTDLTNENMGSLLQTENGSDKESQRVEIIDANPTEMASLVKDAADADDLFEVGGPVDDWTGDTNDLSDGVDGLWLAERSKQTGEKFF